MDNLSGLKDSSKTHLIFRNNFAELDCVLAEALKIVSILIATIPLESFWGNFTCQSGACRIINNFFHILSAATNCFGVYKRYATKQNEKSCQKWL